MFIGACLIAAYVACIVAIQSGVALAFMRRLWRFREEGPPGEELPHATVVLSVRGPDPQLAATIENLLDQEYPRFALHIVVDGRQDPALPLIREVIERKRATNVKISLLGTPKASCSLKCNSLVQAVEELADECEVVAFIDGDALPHRTWLRDLVRPLADPAVGVTTGNRWYAPPSAGWGSLVRYFWNAGAIVQVWMNGIVWAGSMALRKDMIHRIGLPAAWSRALSVDATVYQQIRAHGLGVRFVPSVLLVNTESIGLGKFIGWVQRQMVAAKFCRAGWVMVALHTFALTAIQLVSLSLTLWGLAAGDALVAGISGAALACFWGSSLATTLALESLVRRVVRAHGSTSSWMRPATVARLFPALVLTYLVFPCIFIGATLRRKVSWRGIQYEILGPRRVRMLSYQPIHVGPEIDANTSVV